MWKSFIAILAGLIGAGLVITLVLVLGYWVMSNPDLAQRLENDNLRALMEQVPISAFIVVLVAWSIGGFTGAAVAARIADTRLILHGMAVGAALTLMALLSLLSIPYPAWFWFLNLVIVLPAAILGAWLLSRDASSLPAESLSEDEHY